MHSRLVPLLALLPGLLLAGCGGAGDSGRPRVVAAFYPLQYVAERVAGDHAEVSSLARPGIEPHDLELSPRQTASLADADVVLVESGLQPSVDDAVRNDRPDHLVDAAKVVDLAEVSGGTDPHFWLDPTAMARLAGSFATTMAKVDPAHAGDYRQRGETLQQELATLDREYRAGLATCRTRTVVVSHDAFGYLGRRYHLEVHAIAGLSPDAEPSVRHLAELQDLVRTEHVTTVFSERLASPRLADSLASDLGIRTAVLDPVEGLTSSDSHDDYLTLMRANLAALRTAGGCS